MKQLFPTLIFFHLLSLLLFQNTLRAQPAFRDGYVITKYGDTLRGKVKNSSASEVIFRDSRKNERVFTSEEIREFGRCGFVYTATPVPGDSVPLFIVHLLHGKMDLYATIFPDNTSDAGAGGALIGGLVGGLIGAVAGAAIGAAAAGAPDSLCKEQYYGIGAYYLKKNPDTTLLKIPNGRKKFNEFMIPLMRDHLEVVRETPESMFYTGNSISIVRHYNSVAGGK
jgi:hypothetical protein